MNKPKFSFIADSINVNNSYGMASWEYHSALSREINIVKQRFASFEDAWAINNLISIAYNTGVLDGRNQVRKVVENSLSDY